jgi:hypothetical protein
MLLTKPIQVEDFLDAVNMASDNVYLRSVHGDCYNLKSVLSRYIAIGALLGDHGDELELFCDDPNDEKYFFNFFSDHPEVL